MNFDISWLAVLAAALSAFVIGGIWYGPLFGKVWARESGVDPTSRRGKGMIAIFGATFLLNIVTAAVFAAFLPPGTSVTIAAEAGAAVGIGLVATAYAITYLFTGRSITLLLIDGGYMTVRLIVFGIVLALLGR